VIKTGFVMNQMTCCVLNLIKFMELIKELLRFGMKPYKTKI